MEFHQVIGLIICIGIALGIIIPIVATSVYPRKETNIIPELISSFIKQISLTSKELVYEKNYTVKPGLYLNVSVVGGGVSINSWDKEYVLVKIYKVPGFFNIKSLRENSGQEYSIEYNDTANTLYIEILGYSSEIYIPEKISSMTIYCSGGAIDLSISSTTLRHVYIDVSGGAIEAELSKLENVEAFFSVSGGALDVVLDFIEYSGGSKSSFIVSGGVLNAEIQLPRTTKVKVSGRYSGGITSVELNYERIGANYVDEGYDGAGSKFYLEYRVSGGIANIGIKK